MRAFALELLGVPRRGLPTLVLGVRDLDRLGGQGLVHRRRLEQELDPLPVALVEVVEVVEVPVEPVLQRQEAGLVVLSGDVGIDEWRSSVAELLEVTLVQAAGIDRLTREVEEEPLAETEQIGWRSGPA